MSFTSPQQAASAEAARFNADQAQSLANIALPEIGSTLQGLFKDLKSGQATGITDSVRARFDPLKSQLDADYAGAKRGQTAYITQAAKQSGNLYNTNQISDQLKTAGNALEVSRRDARRSLEFEESAAGLEEYNTLLNLMGSGAGEALGLASGFGGANASAIGLLSNRSPGQGALSGALSGAASGSAINFPYGTIIGGVLGAAGGYYGSMG